MALGENEELKPVPLTGTDNNNLFSRAEFQQLAEVPPEIEWFDNPSGPGVYDRPAGFYGRRRDPPPIVETYEGETPAFGDHQARELLNAPNSGTLKGKRDRAMLSALLFHGLRRQELCHLKVRDIAERRGVAHLRIHGKGGKLDYLPLHLGRFDLRIRRGIRAWRRALLSPLPGRTDQAMTMDGMYKVVRYYTRKIGIGEIEGLGVHSLRRYWLRQMRWITKRILPRYRSG